VLSGNKYRYGIKFMSLNAEDASSSAITLDIDFEIASC
jgi:cell division FtsZ-interacting protein ZapD